MGSRTDEQGALGLGASRMSLAEALDMLRTQRNISSTMGHVIRSGSIPDTASIIPTKPPAEEPPRRSGFISDAAKEMPLGETGQKLIEQICDSMLGPSVPKARK